jgi:hypothetical protein
MARDFDNTDDVAAMNDDELRRLVRDRFDRENAIDPDDLTVHVRDGRVIVSGRVGTEVELRIADHILSDSLGLSNYDNQLVVDPIRRAESPEAVDEHLASEEQLESRLLGEKAVPLNPEAEHHEESLSPHMYGTVDPQEATEGGAPWIPPESPTPEGLGGTETTRGEMSEEH